MEASKMQYLVSLSDETIEKIIALEKEWGRSRDDVIAIAIEIEYNHQTYATPNRMSVAEAAQETASNLTIALLQQSLEEGRTIRIPSLGITIQTKEIE